MRHVKTSILGRGVFLFSNYHGHFMENAKRLGSFSIRLGRFESYREDGESPWRSRLQQVQTASFITLVRHVSRYAATML